MLGALLHVLPDALVGALVTEPEPLDEPVGAVVAPLLPPPEAKKGGSDIHSEGERQSCCQIVRVKDNQ